MLDGYRSGQAAVELYVRAWTWSGHPCDFSAVYQIHERTLESMPRKFTKRPCDGEIGRDVALQDDFDQPVLVGVVEVTQDGEERRHVDVPSVVRLNALNSFTDGTAQIGDTFMRPFRVESVRSVVDRESASPLIGRWVCLEFVNGNS